MSVTGLGTRSYNACDLFVHLSLVSSKSRGPSVLPAQCTKWTLWARVTGPDWGCSQPSFPQCLHWQLKAFKSYPHGSRHGFSYKGCPCSPVECHLDSATHFYCRKRWTTDTLRLSWKRTTPSWLILLAAFGEANAIPEDTQEACDVGKKHNLPSSANTGWPEAELSRNVLMRHQPRP